MDVEKLLIEYWLHFLLTGLSGFLTWAVFKLKIKLEHSTKRWNATENGVQALLRNEIIKSYNYYMERGFVPIHERDNINNLYKQYLNLGGNGTVPRLMDEIEDLPVHDISERMKGE